MDVEALGQPELRAVPTKPPQERGLHDQCAAFAGEQVERARVTATVGQPVLEDARCPSPDREHAAALVGRGAPGLAIADLADPESAELAGMRVAREVDRLQVAQLVEPKTVAVGDLHHDRVAVGGLPTLAAGPADALDLVVRVLEQRVELLARVRALGRATVVGLDMGRGVSVEEHLGRVGAEVSLADAVPAVVGVADVTGERPKRAVVAAQRRVRDMLHRA